MAPFWLPDIEVAEFQPIGLDLGSRRRLHAAEDAQPRQREVVAQIFLHRLLRSRVAVLVAQILPQRQPIHSAIVAQVLALALIPLRDDRDQLAALDERSLYSAIRRWGLQALLPVADGAFASTCRLN